MITVLQVNKSNCTGKYGRACAFNNFSHNSYSSPNIFSNSVLNSLPAFGLCVCVYVCDEMAIVVTHWLHVSSFISITRNWECSVSQVIRIMMCYISYKDISSNTLLCKPEGIFLDHNWFYTGLLSTCINSMFGVQVLLFICLRSFKTLSHAVIIWDNLMHIIYSFFLTCWICKCCREWHLQRMIMMWSSVKKQCLLAMTLPVWHKSPFCLYFDREKDNQEPISSISHAK